MPITAAPAPVAEKKMACYEKMAKGEGECCKDMGKKDAAPAHGEHGNHQH